MVESIPHLSRPARALLAGFRDHERPDRELARRSWHELQARLHHPDAAAREAWARSLPSIDEPYADDDGEDSAAPRTARNDFLYWTRAAATSVAIAAAVLLCVRVVATSATTLTQQARSEALAAPYQGGAQAPRGHAVDGSPAASASESGTRPVRRAPAAAPAAAATPEPPTPEPLPVPVPVNPVPGAEAAAPPAAPALPRKGRTAKPKATELDDVAAELGLVRAATKAHNDGDRGRALKLLNEHTRVFPGGVMADEREVLRAEVLCAQGKKAEAKALVHRFAAAHPTASLLGRMNKACAD